MFVRNNTVKRNGKTYHYPELVESYRKDNGVPAHIKLCSLNGLSEIAVDNLKKALDAGKQGKAVIIAEPDAKAIGAVDVADGFRYLDIAVVCEAFNRLHLDKLLADLMTTRQDDGLLKVIVALVAHRCTSPASKLAAVRWYPTTALPEIQGIAPASFYNTRIHRALTALEIIEDKLQSCLARHLIAEQGPFISLFIDITDTWFEGRGPAMAYPARTKEGFTRQKIGLMLLCDQRGIPLRWKALPGDYYEATEMGSLVEDIAAMDWVREAPLVLDRMMGKATTLAQLAASGVRFVTALPTSEFESWTAEIPWKPFAEVSIAGTESALKEDLKRVHAALERTALQKSRSDRWVLDLGVVTRSDLGEDMTDDDLGPTAQALQLSIAMHDELETGIVQHQLAEQRCISKATIKRYLKLTRLTPAIQQRVLTGEADEVGLALSALIAIAGKPVKKQQAAFNAALKANQSRRTTGRPIEVISGPRHRRSGVSVRLVVSFNPEVFIAQRTTALDNRRELDAVVADLNRRLRTPQSRRTESSIRAEMDRVLRAKGWLKLFDVIVENNTGCWQVRLKLNEDAWAKRRRYDGFYVFVAHPDLPVSPQELVKLYYAKDVVEKDFQTIKSELELRPVRHRTDPKVRAHVILCILALMVERWLEGQLKANGIPMTAAALFEQLEPLRLNLLDFGTGPVGYSVTRPKPDVKKIITALGMQTLIDNLNISETISPRPS